MIKHPEKPRAFQALDLLLKIFLFPPRASLTIFQGRKYENEKQIIPLSTHKNIVQCRQNITRGIVLKRLGSHQGQSAGHSARSETTY